MRTVAVLLVLSSVLSMSPLGMAVNNECETIAAQAQVCLTIPVAKPAPPPPAPSVPDQPYFGTYYLWLAPMKCTEPLSTPCRGLPAGDGSGVPLPTGGAVGVTTFGVLYQESNNVPGLQRTHFIFAGPKQPDRMVLV